MSADAIYVVDGTPTISAITGTIADLKTLQGATAITSCAVGARRAHAADLDRVFNT